MSKSKRLQFEKGRVKRLKTKMEEIKQPEEETPETPITHEEEAQIEQPNE